MTARGRALVVLWMVGAAVAPAAGQPADGGSSSELVFAGLRPTSDPGFRNTALRRLSEAQGLRELAEQVAGEVSGREVFGHDSLREALGGGYLVAFVKCGGEVGCVQRSLAGLSTRGLRLAVMGDYHTRGDRYDFRLTLFRLDDAGPPRTVKFSLSADELEDPAAWERELDPLFLTRGTLAITANVEGAICTVDSQPCGEAVGGQLRVAAGEHVVVLRKEGHIARREIVTVEAGKETRITFKLEPMPLQATQAPTRQPAERSGAPAAPSTTQLFGRIQLSAVYDDHNLGDVWDFSALPDSVLEPEWNTALLPTSVYLGLAYSGPKDPGRFQLRGVIVLGTFFQRRLRIPVAQIDLVREDRGMSLSFGRMLKAVVSSLDPGSLQENSTANGNPLWALTGARLTKTVGSFAAAIAVGRPSSPLSGEEAIAPRLNPGPPSVEARLAYIAADRLGELYGLPAPLLIGVSAAYGGQRVGVNEAPAVSAVDPDAAAPKIETLPTWLASFEILVPLGRIVLAAEGFVARGAEPQGATVLQRSRVDPETGAHTLLATYGGWAQVAYQPAPGWELLAIGSYEKNFEGMDAGIPVSGPGPSAGANRVAALVATWAPRRELRLGLQASQMNTTYPATTYQVAARGRIRSAIFDIMLNF